MRCSAFTGPAPVPTLPCQFTGRALAIQSRRKLRIGSHSSPAVFRPNRSTCNPFVINASVASSAAVQEGFVLQFQTSSGARRLAKAVKPDGKRNWIVCDSNGVSHSITAKQFIFILGPSDDLPASSDDLQQLHSTCEARAVENLDFLQLVWEVVSANGGLDQSNVADVPFISDILFSETDPLSLYATHLLLSRDKLYFKQRNVKGRTLYEARPESQVQEAQLSQQAELARQEQLKVRHNAFVKSLETRSLDLLKDCLGNQQLELLVEGLKQMAGQLDANSKTELVQTAFQTLDADMKTIVAEAFTALGKRSIPSEAIELLVQWRVYKQHENLLLTNSGIPHLQPFSDENLHLVQELLSNPPEDADRERRQDLTYLTSIAIDSTDTTEVDDAISWDPDTNRLLVHIADPTRYFRDGISNPLVREALRRTLTLYLPHTKFTMFPENIANNLFSLDGIDSEGCALTFAFDIGEDGSLMEESVSIQPTLISPPLRLSYENVEEMLSRPPLTDEDALLHNLYRKACLRKEWREMEGGAIIINSPFPQVKVQNPDEDEPVINLGVTSTSTKSWLLVSELMITACTIAAKAAEEGGVPAMFRGQEPFDYPEDDVIEGIPDGPARAAVVFRNAAPSQVSTTPLEHASLGLDSYLQVTSPIRRASDLIAHFQLKAMLRGEKWPFSEEEVQLEISRGSDIARTARMIETRTSRYWQYEYLRRLGPEAIHEAVYVRQAKEGEGRLAFVHLEDYAISLAAAVPLNSKPGARLKIRVQEVNPRTGSAKANAVGGISEDAKEEFNTILDRALSDVSSQSDGE